MFGASFKRNALRIEEFWYTSSLILLVFCVFIENILSVGLAPEIGFSDNANEWSIKKNVKLDIVSWNYKLRRALSKMKATQNLTIPGSVAFCYQHLCQIGDIFQHLANYSTCTSAKTINRHWCCIDCYNGNLFENIGQMNSVNCSSNLNIRGLEL